MLVELIGNGSLAALLDSIASLLTVLFGGAIMLTLVIALAARIAAVPLLEAAARVRSGGKGSGAGSGAGRLGFEQ